MPTTWEEVGVPVAQEKSWEAVGAPVRAATMTAPSKWDTVGTPVTPAPAVAGDGSFRPSVAGVGGPAAAPVAGGPAAAPARPTAASLGTTAGQVPVGSAAGSGVVVGGGSIATIGRMITTPVDPFGLASQLGGDSPQDITVRSVAKGGENINQTIDRLSQTETYVDESGRVVRQTPEQIQEGVNRRAAERSELSAPYLPAAPRTAVGQVAEGIGTGFVETAPLLAAAAPLGAPAAAGRAAGAAAKVAGAGLRTQAAVRGAVAAGAGMTEGNLALGTMEAARTGDASKVTEHLVPDTPEEVILSAIFAGMGARGEIASFRAKARAAAEDLVRSNPRQAAVIRDAAAKSKHKDAGELVRALDEAGAGKATAESAPGIAPSRQIGEVPQNFPQTTREVPPTSPGGVPGSSKLNIPVKETPNATPEVAPPKSGSLPVENPKIVPAEAFEGAGQPAPRVEEGGGAATAGVAETAEAPAPVTPAEPAPVTAKQGKASKHPREMKPQEFYKRYPYQHTILKGADEATIQKMIDEGFSSGIGPNVMSSTQGPPTNIMETKYGTKAGTTVLAVPKEAIIQTPNGPKIKPGYKPTREQFVMIERDYEPLHDAFVRQPKESPRAAEAKTQAAPVREATAEAPASVRPTESAAGVPDQGVQAGDGGVKPPTITRSKGEESPPEVTSQRRVDLERDRKKFGLGQLDSPGRRSWESLRERAMTEYDADKTDEIVSEIAFSKRPATDVEIAAMDVRQVELSNEYDDVIAKLDKATNPATRASLEAQASRIESQVDFLTAVSAATGTEQGRALASRRLSLNREMDLVQVLNRAKQVKGKDLTPEERAAFTKDVNDLKAQNKKIIAQLKRMNEAKAEAAIREVREPRTARQRAKKPEQSLSTLLEKAKKLLAAGCH